jgi:putative intracellular protease/amidase
LHNKKPHRERSIALSPRKSSQKCALLIIADGFEEAETIMMLSTLRQAGICVKSVALTNGLVGGAHGVWLMPDLVLTDVRRAIGTTHINLVILPEGSQSLARLEADPRVHRLLGWVVAQGGRIATSPEGLRVPRAAALWIDDLWASDQDQITPVILRDPGQSPEAFAQNLVRRVQEPSRLTE